MTVELASLAIKSDTIDDMRTALAKTLAAEPDAAKRYPWAKEALTDRTENYVDRFLRANPPGLLAWSQISEHLRTLGYHLEQCLARQDKLFELESACISAVIDCLNAEDLFRANEDLSLAEYAAYAASKPKADQDEIAENVKLKYKTMRDLFDFRVKFFSAPGSALNYNERILFLRRLQADSIRAVYERAKAIRNAMKANGMAALDPPPAWAADRSDTLTELVLWSRSAMRALELHQAREQQASLTVSTLRNPEWFTTAAGEVLTSTKIRDLIRSPGFDEFFLNLNTNILKAAFLPDKPKSLRLISVSCGLLFDGKMESLGSKQISEAVRAEYITEKEVFKEWRAQRRGGARITLPKQDAAHAVEPASWTQGVIYLDDVLRVADDIDGIGMTELPQTRVANMSPLGRWSISINDQFHSPLSTFALSNDEAYGSPWTKVEGLVLSMRLGFTQ